MPTTRQFPVSPGGHPRDVRGPGTGVSASGARSSRFITGVASTPCSITDSTMVKATVDHIQSAPRSPDSPAAYAR